MLHKIQNKTSRIVLFICAFAVALCSLSFALTACGSSADDSEDTAVAKTTEETDADSDVRYILNSSSKKFHKPSCRHVDNMSSKNKLGSSKSRSEIIADGYTPCGTCDP